MASYGDIAGWRAYAAARGNTAPTAADDAVAEAALTRAGDYISHYYVAHFIRMPPEELIVAAAYEAASLELETPGLFNRTWTPAEAKVLVGAGSIRWQVIGGQTGMTPQSSIIEAMLGQYTARNIGLGIRAIG